MKVLLLAALLLPLTATAQQGKGDWESLVGDAFRNLREQAARSTAFHSAEEVYRRGKGHGTLGYVIGIVDGDYASASPRGYCLPEGVSAGQVFDVAWKYLEQNPQDRHYGGPYMVRRGLISAWPCQQ